MEDPCSRSGHQAGMSPSPSEPTPDSDAQPSDVAREWKPGRDDRTRESRASSVLRSDGGEHIEDVRSSSDLRSDGGERTTGSRSSSNLRFDGGEHTDGVRASSNLRSDGGEHIEDVRFSSDLRSDGGERPQAHTIRLELVDEPGELLRALEPIATHGGNLLSIFHERGSLTPRGRVPVEVDLECVPGRFEEIVGALRENGVNVVQAGAERYGEEVTVVLVGHLIGTDLSDTISRIETCASASVADFSLSAGGGMEGTSSARLRLAAEAGTVEAALDVVRELADEKDLTVIEPLLEAEP